MPEGSCSLQHESFPDFDAVRSALTSAFAIMRTTAPRAGLRLISRDSPLSKFSEVLTGTKTRGFRELLGCGYQKVSQNL